MMLHLFLDKGPWFRAKKYGYGAGLPFKWQGWALLGLYLLAIVSPAFLVRQEAALSKITVVGFMLAVTTIFLVIVRKRTEGGWKWRGD
jgi:hypothetical protein